MNIYEKTNVARALLYWAKNNNGNECYYLEDRMYAVADGDMVIILTADSYDEAKRKAKARHTQERPQGEWKTVEGVDGDEYYECSNCGEPWVLTAGTPKDNNMNFCPNCGADMRKESDNETDN